MRIKKKKWARPYLEEHQDKVLLDPEFTYKISKSRKSLLEIGCGKGSFIIEMAKRHPEIDFYGLEISADVLAITLKKVIQEELSNVYLIRADMEQMMLSMLDNSFDYIFISHPDPWPKKRHEKRRLLYPNFLKVYKRILKDDGRIYFKTDSDGLFEYALTIINETNILKIESVDEDYINNTEFDAPTEYEKRFRREGIKIKRIILSKENEKDVK